MDPYHSIGMVVLAMALVLCNAFFVLSEFAIVKVRPSRLEELSKQGHEGAKLAMEVSERLDSYLSATQLGITLSSIALGWVGEGIARVMLSGMGLFMQETAVLNTVSVVISFVVVTLMHVILGEIVPKSFAIAKTDNAVLTIVRPIRMFYIAFYPAIKLLDYLSASFLRAMKVRGGSKAHSDEELKIIVGESLKDGFLDSVQGEIIKNAVDFGDTVAKEIMIPRKDMVCLDRAKSYEENLNTLLGSNVTKYPYCDGSKDKVIGIIHIRDLFISNFQNPGRAMTPDFDSIVRKMLIFPESAPVSKMLRKMNEKENYSALVIDEYGGTAGLVTIEDIMKEVLGNLAIDEKSQIKKIDDRSYEVDGMVGLEDLQEELNLDRKHDLEHVTVGGYVLNLFGDLPKAGDSVSDHECEYTVLDIEETRVKKLKVTLKE